MDNLYGSIVLKEYFLDPSFQTDKLVVVSPDAGGHLPRPSAFFFFFVSPLPLPWRCPFVSLLMPCRPPPLPPGVERADNFREYMRRKGVESDFAVINKRRKGANKIASMELIGSVEDAVCIIVDDMIDTAGTLCAAAQGSVSFPLFLLFACASLFLSPNLPTTSCVFHSLPRFCACVCSLVCMCTSPALAPSSPLCLCALWGVPFPFIPMSTALADSGARSVYAVASHGLFSTPAHERITASVLEKVVALVLFHSSPVFSSR